MADLLDFAPVRVFTTNAAPGAGYIARFYQSGTTTPVTVYSDLALTTPLGSSVTANAEGVFVAVFSTGGAIKATIETPAGAVVATVDPVQSVPASSSSAGSVTFSPSINNPSTNVQDAIDLVSARNRTSRNLIINGQGRINQRVYVSGTATGGANQYTLDRWRVVTSGQSLTFTGNDAGRTMTAPAGGVEQVIEGANIEGGTYVLNWTGTATASVNGTARTKGETFTLPANTNATVRFTSGTFTDVQLEFGSGVTVFDRLSWQQELAACQRYFFAPNPGGVASQSNVSAYASALGQDQFFLYNFPVSMRAAPTISGSWSSLANATANAFRAVDPLTLEGSIKSVGAGVYSGVVTVTSATAEL